MKKRVFAAVNLPFEIKAAIEASLSEFGKLWPSFDSARILDQSNWHITMGFFGDQDEARIALIEEAMTETAVRFGPPEIKLEKIVFGPTGKVEFKMLWLTVTSADLQEIKADFDSSLEKRSIILDDRDRKFSPHITLARFNPVVASRLPAISEDIDLLFKPRSFDFMESRLTPFGADYLLLAEIDFSRGS